MIRSANVSKMRITLFLLYDLSLPLGIVTRLFMSYSTTTLPDSDTEKKNSPLLIAATASSCVLGSTTLIAPATVLLVLLSVLLAPAVIPATYAVA